LCCQYNNSGDDIPGISFGETAEETLTSFVGLRSDIIEKSMAGGSDKESSALIPGCAECGAFKLDEWPVSSGLIHSINLSMYPSVCQCKCIYCPLIEGKWGRYDKRLHSQIFEKLFDTITCAQKDGMIYKGAHWSISSGEIAVHPYRNKIFSLIEDYGNIAFHSNCFVFDQGIADSLAKKPISSLNLSIDCGTRETWRDVKGVDNFDEVIANLMRYSSICSRPDQIRLKYIVLPNVNSYREDYMEVIMLMKRLKIKHLTIASDMRYVYTMSGDQKEELVACVGYMLALLNKYGLKYSTISMPGAGVTNNAFLYSKNIKI